jgi:hypothetical protein
MAGPDAIADTETTPPDQPKPPPGAEEEDPPPPPPRSAPVKAEAGRETEGGGGQGVSVSYKAEVRALLDELQLSERLRPRG